MKESHHHHTTGREWGPRHSRFDKGFSLKKRDAKIIIQRGGGRSGRTSPHYIRSAHQSAGTAEEKGDRPWGRLDTQRSSGPLFISPPPLFCVKKVERDRGVVDGRLPPQRRGQEQRQKKRSGPLGRGINGVLGWGGDGGAPKFE